MLRQFYLKNENGIKFNLSPYSSVVLLNPNGLGITNNYQYNQYDNYFSSYENKLKMTNITGTLYLMDGYRGYQSLLDYISNSTDLRFFYKSTEEKYIYVDINSITKTELKSNILQCNISFNKKSYWIKETIKYAQVEAKANGKTFDYIFDYVFGDSMGGEFTLTNNGDLDAPVNIKIIGEFIEPEVEVYDIDNNLLYSTKLFVSANNGDSYIEIISEEGKEKMIMFDGEVETNIFDKQDFSRTGFLYLTKGTNHIKFIPNTLNKVVLELTYLERFNGN